MDLEYCENDVPRRLVSPMSALRPSSKASALVAATNNGARGKVEAPEVSAQDAGSEVAVTAAGEVRGRAGAGEVLLPVCGGGVVELDKDVAIVMTGTPVDVVVGAVIGDGLIGGAGATGMVESAHEASAEREKV